MFAYFAFCLLFHSVCELLVHYTTTATFCVVWCYFTSLLCSNQSVYSLIPSVCKYFFGKTIKVRLREKKEQPQSVGVCCSNAKQTLYIDPCWLCAVSQEIAEELGFLSSDSSEEEVLTTRVVRRRVIIQVMTRCSCGPQCLWEQCRVTVCFCNIS